MRCCRLHDALQAPICRTRGWLRGACRKKWQWRKTPRSLYNPRNTNKTIVSFIAMAHAPAYSVFLGRFRPSTQSIKYGLSDCLTVTTIPSTRTFAIHRTCTRRFERFCTHAVAQPPTQAAYPHVPVLLDEVLRLLQPLQIHAYADCTLGAGGHAAAVLQAHPVRTSDTHP